MFFDKKEDFEMTQFQTMLKLVNLWFHGVSRGRAAVQKGLVYLWTVLNIVAQLSVLKVGFALYLDISMGCFMIINGYLNVQALIYLKKVDTMNHFFVTMRKILSKRRGGWEAEVYDGFVSRAWRLARFNFNTIFVFWWLQIGLPIAYDAYLAAFTDSVEPFYTSNFHISWVPAPVRRDGPYYLSTATSCYITLIAAPNLCMFMSLVPTAVAYMCAELRMVGRDLELWSQDRRSPDRRAALQRIIRDHQQILGLIEIMRKYLGELLLPQNVLTSLVITLLLFSFTEAVKIWDIDLLMRMSYIMSLFILVAFVNCYSAQDLKDENERLSNVLYMISWYEESPQVRKILLMMMMVTSHKPLTINYKGLLHMSLRMFGEIIQATYSFFMLLQSTL